MNFLAHAYLSFNDPYLLIGNMISDFLKGKKRYDYIIQIQHGIELHRRIDTYTDNHEQVKIAKNIFKEDYRLYNGPITDIIFDHYLANDKNIFDNDVLKTFTSITYKILEEHASLLPQNFLNILPYMISDDWLYNYHKKTGIQKSLKGLVRRSSFLTESETAYKLFEENYYELQKCYDLFINDVKQFAKQQIIELV